MSRLLAVFVLLASPLWAAPPRVVTDIAPVHSLVATVMGDLGTPDLLLPPDADPHHFTLRPSQARLLTDADLLIWMGPALTPWMARISQTLTDGEQLRLLSLDTLASRIEDGSHNHATLDPHAWLDPMNAVAFLAAISNALSAIDPDNARIYAANSDVAIVGVNALSEAIQARLAPAGDAVLIPYHDAYRYFLSRYGLQAAGSIADHDAAQPSAARLREIQAILANADHGCIFTEPGRNTDLVAGLTRNSGIRIRTLDPIGATLRPGPDLYESLITAMADTIANCAIP